MIKHIVMWKLKERAEGADRAANAARMKDALQGCSHLVPGIVEFEVAVAQADLEATCDVVLYSVFADRTALDAYQKHPEHVALKPFIAAVRAERQCIDYEI